MTRATTYRTFSIITLTFFTSLLAGILLYALFFTPTYLAYPFDFTITSDTAFNLDTDAIHFGAVRPGSISKRHATIHARAPSTIHVISRGADFVYPEVSSFTLKKGEHKTITLTANIPPTAPYGFYNGTILLRIKRTLF